MTLLVPFFAAASLHDQTVAWIRGSGFHIVIIIFSAWLIRRILAMAITGVMRRAMHIEQTFATDLDREKRMETFIALTNAGISIVVWAIAGISIMQELGIKPGPLMTGAGVIGVALTFGMQSLFKDFISGFFIVMENQYRVGDDVELDATKGVVEHVGIRTTVLRDTDGNIHFIPNGLIQRTTNKSLGFSTLRFSLTVNSATDMDELEAIINKLGERLASEKKWQPHFVESLHYSELGEFTDRKHEVLISGKVKTAYKPNISTDFRKRLLEKLKNKEIKVIKLSEVAIESDTTDKDKK
jgi:moderate conductance mechanosensitive channel